MCIFITYNTHAFTIKSGQVWSSDGNVYNFASPDEKKKLIEKYKNGGDQVGVLNNQLFIVVDEDINVHDMDDVIWAITTRADAARDTIIINNTPTDTLDPASPLVNLGSKMGIDATQKTKEEGYMREIQQQVKVDEKTKNLVDSKWSEYGL